MRLCLLGVLLAWLVAPWPAVAQTNLPLRLEWKAPKACPSRAEVDEKIRRAVSVAPTEPVIVRVVVQRENARRYHVTIHLRGALRGDRSLDAESCEAAADATALLVALAIDPEQANLTATPPGDPAQNAPPEPNATTPPPTIQQPAAPIDRVENPADANANADTDASSSDSEAPSSDSDDQTNAATLKLAPGLGAGITTDWGTLPGPTLGLALQINVAIERVLLAVTGQWLMAREETIGPNAALSASWLSAALDGCYLAGTTLQLGPCLGFEAGKFAVTARGLLDTTDANEAALFVSGSFLGRARLTTALYAALWLGMRTPVSYPRLLVSGVGEAFRPASVGVRATLLLTAVLE